MSWLQATCSRAYSQITGGASQWLLVGSAATLACTLRQARRWRVGRGEHASDCLLLADSANAESDERLRTIESTNDGFALAEKDLELRGPGEFFGTRQSGLPDMWLANLADMKLLEQAREQAQKLFEADPTLTAPENQRLAQKVKQFWASASDAS